MPFEIIRNDITKVSADAIVNTANPMPICGGGTDKAIYKAAGKSKLLEARKEIGCIADGEVAVTPGFELNARYIIHTVGPEWIDGKHREFDILEQCYRNSLNKAKELECESIAFPLISTGTYGFPKDKALQIAVKVFSEFLSDNDMQIILVVYDVKSFELSEKIVGEIDSYIDDNYVDMNRRIGGARTGLFATKARGSAKKARIDEMVERNADISCEEIDCAPMPMPLVSMSFEPAVEYGSIEDELDHIGMSFHDKLFELILKSGLDNKDVWKLANLDRKHFSKIQCDANYHPKKKTVMALCIALRLSLEESKDLLSRADWAFSPSSKVDLIVQKAIIDKQYDIMQLNLTLFKYTNEILGV